ncbi:MAG: hypothetical protein IKZ47_07590 [Clostridia bacterium]|nr:hypothetical protein [Clostridia bacterium]
MRYKLPIKLGITRIFANKRFAIAFSLILSFAIWLSVMINENPTREQVFTNVKLNISIDNTDLSSRGFGIVSDISTQNFIVTLSGPNYIVSSLTADDFVLSADIPSIESAGIYRLAVYCNRNSSKSGYTFKSISPSTIDVKFDKIDTKEFKIVPELPGVSAKNGLIAEKPVVANSEQSTITVKGPRETVEKIVSVGSYSDVVKTLDTTETFTSYVVLYTDDNKVLYKYLSDGTVVNGSGSKVENNYLTLSYTSLKVTQRISKTATLEVKPVFADIPAGLSAKDIKYKVEPSEVTVIGTPSVVSGMTSVNLAPIDFSGISTSSNTFEVSASLNDGVRLDDSVEYFTVTVDTTEYEEKTFNNIKVRSTGLGSSMKFSALTGVNSVKICGPKDVVNKIKSTDLYALADLSNKSSTGSFNVSVKIKSDKYNNIWQVGDYTATVTIS